MYGSGDGTGRAILVRFGSGDGLTGPGTGPGTGAFGSGSPGTGSSSYQNGPSGEEWRGRLLEGKQGAKKW